MSGLVGQIGAKSGIVGSTTDSTQLDYEEGTWTPVHGSGLSGSSFSFSCSYTKIGNVVSLYFRVNGTSMDVSSYATFSGLPFTPTGDASGFYVPGGANDTGGQMLINGTTLYMGPFITATTTTSFRGSLIYFT